MRVKLAWFFGLLPAANGVFMIVASAAWYPIFPSVVAIRLFNAHFIRDIGVAFLVAGIGFVCFANDARARPATLAGAEIVARWGRRALVSLAFGITTARILTTLKYALGYGGTCTQVKVGGTTTAVTRRQAA